MSFLFVLFVNCSEHNQTPICFSEDAVKTFISLTSAGASFLTVKMVNSVDQFVLKGLKSSNLPNYHIICVQKSQSNLSFYSYLNFKKTVNTHTITV